MNIRAHPTVRPFALALGVFPRASAAERLSFLGPAAAPDFAGALLLDTLGALSTFPVRHRVVFTDGSDAVTRQIKLPATWRELPQRGDTPAQKLLAALEDLLGLGAEAVLLLSGDGPAMPLGALFDALMWLLPKQRVVIGPGEPSGLFAFGAADPASWLLEVPPRASGLSIVGDEPFVASATEVAQAAEARGFAAQSLPSNYRVLDRASLERLHADVQKGAFAPACRKLFDRPDVRALLG